MQMIIRVQVTIHNEYENVGNITSMLTSTCLNLPFTSTLVKFVVGLL